MKFLYEIDIPDKECISLDKLARMRDKEMNWKDLIDKTILFAVKKLSPRSSVTYVGPSNMQNSLSKEAKETFDYLFG